MNKSVFIITIITSTLIFNSLSMKIEYSDEQIDLCNQILNNINHADKIFTFETSSEIKDALSEGSKEYNDYYELLKNEKYLEAEKQLATEQPEFLVGKIITEIETINTDLLCAKKTLETAENIASDLKKLIEYELAEKLFGEKSQEIHEKALDLTIYLQQDKTKKELFTKSFTTWKKIITNLESIDSQKKNVTSIKNMLEDIKTLRENNLETYIAYAELTRVINKTNKILKMNNMPNNE